MAYNEGTLQQQSVLDVTPNGSGGGIWMSGAGPAADANGNVFLATSEGTFDTTLNGVSTDEQRLRQRIFEDPIAERCAERV